MSEQQYRDALWEIAMGRSDDPVAFARSVIIRAHPDHDKAVAEAADLNGEGLTLDQVKERLGLSGGHP